MSRKYVVTAEYMLSIDRQSHTRHQSEHPFSYDQAGQGRSVFELGVAGVLGVRLGKHGDEHGDSSVVV